MRDMVFISHANPEDNELSRWLALRLAREGYPVWCDLTKLLGGETFWRDIEKAIRERAVKFLYVLSKHSNHKDGALNELDLALGVERSQKLTDFVIPLRADDLPFNDIQIQIHRKNAIDFSTAWATGLTMLLKKLKEDNVPRDSRFDAAAVCRWWQSEREGDELLKPVPEALLSNWFPIESMPPALRVHALRPNALHGGGWTLAQPAHRVGDWLVSFAPASEFGQLVGRTNEVALDYAITSDDRDLPLTARQYRDSVVHLLRLAWDRAIAAKKMPTYELSQRRKVAYFTESMYTGSRLPFELPDGFSGSRAMVGFKTVWSASAREKAKRFWHYGLSADARLSPIPAIILNAHILFSDDGKTIWDSPKRLHSARRSQGSGWWNADWRDRLMASVAWIAGTDKSIKLPVSTTESILVSRVPVPFESTLSYVDEIARHADLTETVFDDSEPTPADEASITEGDT